MSNVNRFKVLRNYRLYDHREGVRQIAADVSVHAKQDVAERAHASAPGRSEGDETRPG